MFEQFSDAEKTDTAQREEAVLKYWKENNIFQKTLDKESPEGEFVFYEGPPTANGRPGIHHLESRVFKDAIPRFRTMQGYHVPRKGGWDTHGLPVELEVEKDLDITTKDEIKEFGVGEFNEKCKESVWNYIEEWEAFTDRMGYWLDYEDSYITYSPDYMESVWNRFAQADKQDLVYKDYKVVPWCPRCETALSSHEQAQGYEEVKDLAVTAKFELKKPEQLLKELGGSSARSARSRQGRDSPEAAGQASKNIFLLAWTTTPWTLPANLALAVSEDITYVRITTEDDQGSFILAKDRLEEIVTEADKEYEIQEEFTGDKLVGLEYKPLYPYAQDKLEADKFADTRDNAFQIYKADFVTTEEGTGIVHTAVMYGQDDFDLGEQVNLPRLHLVDQTGHFKEGLGFLSERFVHEEDVAVDIIKDLYHRDIGGETGLLFDKGKFAHEYPHCWRCDTPLVYYARNSWYIAMTELREELLAENEKINWHPDHIKDGRFGEWLDGVQDWAVSRERFWGTPLPIWEAEDGDDWAVIGSLAELREKTESSNNFWAMRHGGAEHNEKNEVNSGDPDKYGLTADGQASVREAAEQLADIDVIITSPFRRCTETAAIIADQCNLNESAVITDDRIREYDFGDFDGGSMSEYRQWRENQDNPYTTPVPNGESFQDYKERVGDFLYAIDEEYEDTNILIVSHGAFLEALPAVLQGADVQESARLREQHNEGPGDITEFTFAPIPHNENYELDLHRPYIDEITWKNDAGNRMRRVPEVMDVWFDSGCVPYAQHHYPFENQEYVDSEGYPADFISEAIDQTRGWFYTLHAIGVFSGMGQAYENVISLGHILDANGEKMSKSRGNTVDPWEAMGKFGVDTIRFWMYSINQPGESKNFAEDTVDEIQKKVFNLVENVNRFYHMYGGDTVDSSDLIDPYDSPHVLDRWILFKLNQLVVDSTEALENYDLNTPTRRLREFIGDLSRWYIRRSRDRFKSDDADQDRQFAQSVTQHVLETLSRLLAPFAPFFAEQLYQDVAVDKAGSETVAVDSLDTEYAGSVHLEDWPQSRIDSVDADESLLESMAAVREAASTARDIRSQEGLKVRQPLSTLRIPEEKSQFMDNDGLVSVLKDEVNVKGVVADSEISEIKLNTELTEPLKQEGAARELVRQIQKLRKQAELDPQDKIRLVVDTDSDGWQLINDFQDTIAGTANLHTIERSDIQEADKSITLMDSSIRLSLADI